MRTLAEIGIALGVCDVLALLDAARRYLSRRAEYLRLETDSRFGTPQQRAGRR